MGDLLNWRFAILRDHKIKKMGQICLVGDDGMFGIPLFELEEVNKRLNDEVMAFHKNNSCKVTNTLQLYNIVVEEEAYASIFPLAIFCL